MNEFDEMDNCIKKVKKILDQLKRRPLRCGYSEIVVQCTEEERKAISEKFWNALMETPLYADDVIAKGGFHDIKS